MNHLKSSLSKVSAVAVVLGLVACAHNNPQSAQAPQNPAEQQPSMSEQYGSAMGQQPGTTGNEMGQPAQTPSMEQQPGAPYGQQGPSTGAQGAYGQPGGAYGQTGNPYGQGQSGTTSGQATGSEYGGGGQMGGAATGEAGQMGGMGATGQVGGMGQPGGSMDVSTLNDNQIAAVIQAINKGEIQEAQIAATKARSPEVKQFAQAMANEHRQMETRAEQLFSRLQITPSDNTVSQQLRSDAQSHLSNLQSMRGNDFDQAFIADQVQAHNRALELIDRAIPNVKNPEMKSELQNVRAKVAAHLADAERIQTMLQKGSTTRQGQGNQNDTNQGQSQPYPSGNPDQNQNH